jgi:NAD(P)-dependent dehydrogenase (short-subunit alcohol dehydrogenase family)
LEIEELKDQVAIVTGGASGMGRETCRALAAEGVRVVVADLSPEGLEETRAGLDAVPSGPHLGRRVDVSHEEDVASLVSYTKDSAGRIDILVHCAGVLRLPGSGPRLMTQTSTEEFDHVVGVNLRGTFLCNRAVAAVMVKQRSGQILNVSSTSGRKGRAFDSIYCASKFGVVGLTESLAEEVRSQGIRVQLILPDAVATPFWEQNGPVGMPDWALPPERVARVITHMLALPMDTVLENVVVMPLRARKRRTKDRGAE